MPASTLLSWIVFLPAVGAAVVLLLQSAVLQRRAALLFTGLPFGLSLLMAPSLWGAGSTYGVASWVHRFDWITTADGSFRVEYYLGVDGLSYPLLLLAGLLGVLAVAASWNFERWKTRRGLKGYLALLLLLQTGVLGVFTALDFFLFYIFFELVLLPMYFLIGVWGGPRREYAAIKFLIYTLAGSVLLLIGMLALYFYAPVGQRTFDLLALATMPALQSLFHDPNTRFLGWAFAPAVFLLLAIGFMVKVPVVPLHTWLPDAHVEAPTPISMLLAGVLLKLGGYGLVRIAWPILPAAAAELSWLIGALGVVAILYGGLCTLAQQDFKRLVAYSSVAHMGYVVLGLSAFSSTGLHGAVFQMLAHGISSPMCFYLAGVLEQRAGHRDLSRFGGLWLSLPRCGAYATLAFFATLGLPGLCGFVGEVLAILGTFESPVLRASGGLHVWYGVLSAAGAIVAAAYVLWLMQRVFLGPPRPEQADWTDLDRRESAVLAPLAVLVVALGVLPHWTVMKFISGPLTGLLTLMQKSAGVGGGP